MKNKLIHLFKLSVYIVKQCKILFILLSVIILPFWGTQAHSQGLKLTLKFVDLLEGLIRPIAVHTRGHSLHSKTGREQK